MIGLLVDEMVCSAWILNGTSMMLYFGQPEPSAMIACKAWCFVAAFDDFQNIAILNCCLGLATKSTQPQRAVTL